jgi:serine/threonine-protein kinase
MTTEAFHPDHLRPGHMVGAYRIVEPLGSGNFGRVFKAERDGNLFTLKMAVRPAPELPQQTPEKALEEREVDARMSHEGAILMANTSHPGLPHLRAVDRWPHSTRGYLYLVMDYLPGEPFHTWRKRTRPTAAQLVDLFIEVVRVVGLLHSRGILIRDFKAEHVIVGLEDNRPMLVDLGSAWFPGGSILTVGLAPGTPHALPPECIAFIREGAWKQGARFEASAAGDLYQLGVFMYEALTECWPFDPRLTQEELLVAIETAIPRAPHRMNPEVPEALSHIALRLLEKRPEERYESAEALLQALWDAAKERSKKPWKVPLRLPPEGPAPVTQDEVEERRLQKQEAERRAQEPREEQLSREQELEQQLSFLTQAIEDQVLATEEKAARRKKGWRRIPLAVSPLVLGLALFIAWWVWLAPATMSPAEFEKGNPLVSTLSNSRPVRAIAASLCATLAVGCPAAQVRPLPADCPRETLQSMDKLGLLPLGAEMREYLALVDINNPGDPGQQGISPPPGKLVSRLLEGPLPAGALLYGQVWTEGLTKGGREAVYGRYTEVLLPDGRRLPVCMVLGEGFTGLSVKADLRREWSVTAVDIIP